MIVIAWTWWEEGGAPIEPMIMEVWENQESNEIQ